MSSPTQQTKICTQKFLPHIPGVFSAMSTKGKTWDVGQTIDICFLDGTDKENERIIQAASVWLLHCNLNFRWTDSIGNSDVRISHKERGAWSFIGTDANYIPKDRATMNFGWLDDPTIIHEFGHFLGRLHEHQHPDKDFDFHKENVLRILGSPPNSWDSNTIYYNVLNMQKNENVIKDDYDRRSIMHYFYPASFTTKGVAFPINKVLSKGDIAHAKKVYPFPPPTVNDKVLHALITVYATDRIKRLYVRDHKEVIDLLGVKTTAKREMDFIQAIRRHLSNLNIQA